MSLCRKKNVPNILYSIKRRLILIIPNASTEGIKKKKNLINLSPTTRYQHLDFEDKKRKPRVTKRLNNTTKSEKNHKNIYTYSGMATF